MTGVFLEQGDKIITSAPASALSADWTLPAGTVFASKTSDRMLVPLRKTRFSLPELIQAAIDVTSGGGQADGVGLKLGSFPEGHVGIVGAIPNFQLVTAAGVTATGVVWSLGTAAAATADAALTSTEADIIKSSTLGDGTIAAATAEVCNTPILGNANADGLSILDGSATAKDIYLNVAGTWIKASGATSSFTLGKVSTQDKAYVDLFWYHLGDD